MRVPASLLANLPCSGVRERTIIDLMSRIAARIAFLVIPAFAAGALGIPETAITRTHLLKDSERASVTVALGMELDLTENPAYMGDSLFGYLGYAPFDWLELGLGAYAVSLRFVPSIEAKVDLVDMFSDDSRISLLLMGGFGGLPNELLFYQAGLGVNFRISRPLQLYLGAGSDSISTAMSLQAGAFLTLLKSLGVSANAKLVIGREGTAPAFSIAPLILLSKRSPGQSRTSAASSR